jgi:hypothetical protein
VAAKIGRRRKLPVDDQGGTPETAQLAAMSWLCRLRLLRSIIP